MKKKIKSGDVIPFPPPQFSSPISTSLREKIDDIEIGYIIHAGEANLSIEEVTEKILHAIREEVRKLKKRLGKCSNGKKHDWDESECPIECRVCGTTLDWHDAMIFALDDMLKRLK